MSDKEIALNITLALIGNINGLYTEASFVEQVAQAYETIYNKVHSLND